MSTFFQKETFKEIIIYLIKKFLLLVKIKKKRMSYINIEKKLKIKKMIKSLLII